jgi:hypothetical protein
LGTAISDYVALLVDCGLDEKGGRGSITAKAKTAYFVIFIGRGSLFFKHVVGLLRS